MTFGPYLLVVDGVGASVMDRVPLAMITRRGRATLFAAVLEPVAAGGQPAVSDIAAEMHTTVSAHPFVADLPPGQYVVTVERGKEYFPETREVTVAAEPLELRIPLRRWIDMAQRGWYCGETHIHRTLDELRNVVLAEDLNVAFPLSFWVTRAFAMLLPQAAWACPIFRGVPSVW